MLKPVLAASGPGKITFMDLTGLSYPVMAGGLAAVLVLALVGLEMWRPWRADLGADVDGDFGPTPAKAARPHLEPAE